MDHTEAELVLQRVDEMEVGVREADGSRLEFFVFHQSSILRLEQTGVVAREQHRTPTDSNSLSERYRHAKNSHKTLYLDRTVVYNLQDCHRNCPAVFTSEEDRNAKRSPKPSLNYAELERQDSGGGRLQGAARPRPRSTERTIRNQPNCLDGQT